MLDDERPCEAEHVSALYCRGHLLEEVDGLLHFTLLLLLLLLLFLFLYIFFITLGSKDPEG